MLHEFLPPDGDNIKYRHTAVSSQPLAGFRPREKGGILFLKQVKKAVTG